MRNGCSRRGCRSRDPAKMGTSPVTPLAGPKIRILHSVVCKMKMLRSLPLIALLALVLHMIFGAPGSRAQLSHNPGKVCASCHQDLKIGGTVFTDGSAARGQEGVGITLISEDGLEVPIGTTGSSGNIAASTSPEGRFLIRAGNLTSCTWHALSAQGMCNFCHV